MALIFPGKSLCPICGGIIASDDEIVATSHFVTNQADPLWRFSDAAMHKRCFLGWELRESFVDCFNHTVGAITWGNGTFQEMLRDGTIAIRQRTGGAC